MKKYWVAILLLSIFILYSAYASAFFAWVTATPLTPENLKRAQSLFKLWFGGFWVGILVLATIVVRMANLRRQRKKNIS